MGGGRTGGPVVKALGYHYNLDGDLHGGYLEKENLA